MAPPSEADIRKILSSTQAYSPNSVGILEEYVVAMASKDGNVPYMFDAVRVLIKLYSQQPDTKTRDDMIMLALLLAMLEYPSTDLLALSYLIPMSIQQTIRQQNKDNSDTATSKSCTMIATIQECSEQLDQCRYIDFWKTYNTFLTGSSADDAGADEDSKKSHALAQDLAKRSIKRLQESILNVLALTYREAPLSMVLTAIGVQDSDGKPGVVAGATSSPNDFLQSCTNVVQSVSKDTVVFVPTSDNTKRERVYQQGVGIATIGNLLHKMAL